jgi:hypothetical protein
MSRKYYTKLSKSTSKKRKVFWNSLEKYPFTKDQYDKAKEVPGDSKSKTKTSKYTIKFKKKFGNLEEAKKKKSKAIVTLQKKSKASKIPYSVLKKVYNRGMAAWVTGHRPGASQTQWALARVNSFITKGKTWKTTDSDLAKKVRSLKEEHIFEYEHWGWISPDGELILPIDTDKTHTSILRRIKRENLTEKETEFSATKKGWIRWLVQGPALWINTINLIKKREIWNTLRSLIYKHKVNREFLFEYRNEKTSELTRIEYERGQFKPFLLAVGKLYSINENFDLSNIRNWFGWIKPDGTELRPKDQSDIYHSDLINNYAKELRPIDRQKPPGWIRWSVSNSWRSDRYKKLSFDVYDNIKTLPQKQYKKFLEVAKDIVDFFDIEELDVTTRIVGKDNTFKIYTFSNFLEMKTNLSVMRNSSKNIKEDTDKEYKKVVIFPGGFHPPHSGHLSVWNKLKEEFPEADIYVASSNTSTERPLSFQDKKELWMELGVEESSIIEVKVPYVSKEITSKYNPKETVVIFALSEKDSNRISYTKKDGSPGYFSEWGSSEDLKPLEEKGYIYISPKINFIVLGINIDSASKIRELYKKSTDANRSKIIKELYPKSVNLEKIKEILDRNFLEKINEKMVKVGNKYNVYSEKGKHMGGPYTLDQAKKRLRQIEYYK